jgi:thioredoxin reductase (NADPH)
MREIETIIVGAGPIGLETAAELGRRELPCLILDAGALGQQILDFPPMTRWFSSPERLSIAGVPFTTPSHEKGSREEYLAYLRAVADQFELEVRTFERVEAVTRDGEQRFELRTRTLSGMERAYRCASLVLATGGTAIPRNLGIPGEEMPHVHRSIGEPHRFHGRRLLIVGGRNAACEAAVHAFRSGAEVTISYRGAALHERVKYWIRPELEAMIESEQVHAVFGTVPERIEPDRVVLRPVDGGDAFEVEADDVLLALGYESDMSLFESLGAELEGEERRVVHDESTMRTTVPGVFVAGTAVAGSQHRFRVYVENSHVHAWRIAAALAGDPPPADPALPVLPES